MWTVRRMDAGMQLAVGAHPLLGLEDHTGAPAAGLRRIQDELLAILGDGLACLQPPVTGSQAQAR